MKSFKNFLWILYHPSYWIMNEPYSRLWDMKLQLLMKENKFQIIDRCYAKIGDYTLWIENHPYASFVYRNVRPSRITIHMAYDKLLLDIFK